MHPLLNLLNLDHPGLERVKSALDARNVSAALDELVAWFRARPEPDPALLAGPDPSVVAYADAAIRREFDFYHEKGTLPPSPDIDWTWRPGIDREWTWALNRHGWWRSLASAYLATGEARYARELDAEVRTWVGGHPPTTEDGSCWRTIEAGIRTSSPWPAILGAIKKSPDFTRTAWLYYLRSIHDHAEFLLAHPKGGNWLLMETNGVLTCGLVFPEFRRAGDWVRIAIEKFEAEMVAQVHPDGGQVEYSTGYQFVCIRNFEAVLDKVERSGRVRFSSTYRDRLIAMWEHVAYMARPDGRLPMLNDADQHGDHDDGIPSLFRQILSAGEKFHRPDFTFVATGGDRGRPPEKTSLQFPWVRRAVMRSGWDRNAFYGMLECAPFGYGHQHEDALTVELAAFGRPLIGTMGRYTYAGVPERRYLTSSEGHNVILVDGHGQNLRSLREQGRGPGERPDAWVAKAPVSGGWESTPERDVATGRFEGPWHGGLEGISWERTLLFHKPGPDRPGFWLIRDRVDGRGEHDLDVLLHFYPGEISFSPTRAHIVTDYGPDGGNGVIRFLDPERWTVDAARGRKDPARGWFSVEYGRIEPAWEARVKRRVTLPFEWAFVCVPFRGAGAPDVDLSGIGGAFTVRLGGADWPVQL